ncbi:MAG: NAD(P)H-dependent oxidoreductase [Candidatus Nanoarchaeia archaeon]
MTTLVIYAHPTTEGHNANILTKVETELKKRKQKYEVLNLYNENFNPILSKEELITRNKPSKEIKKYQDKITKSDKLILIYPIWWNAPPAILKGFIDRVFAAGYAFRYKPTALGAMPEGLLKGKKAAVFTTGGGPELYFKYILASRGSKIVVNDTLTFCGIKSKGFHYGNARALTPAVDAKLEKLVAKGIKWMYS